MKIPLLLWARQTVILKDCNIDGGILTKFDADAEYLDEDMDFTFEGFRDARKPSICWREWSNTVKTRPHFENVGGFFFSISK